MPKTYKHLDNHERDLLSILKNKGQSLRDIAKALGRHPSSLSRELRRNAPPIYTGYYLPYRAQIRAENRARKSRTHKRLRNPLVRRYVKKHLRMGWSPELIAGRLKIKHPGLFVSHEAIYQWIYADAREFIPRLVRSHRKRYPRGHSHRHKKLHVPERISIRKRPKHVEQRRQLGHWEADTMISRASAPALQVVVERKTRLTKITKLPAKASRPMSVALSRRLSRHPRNARITITYDNGSENHEHMRTNRVLGTRSYFCEPYHSWERGSVENRIGIVRRFFPKKTDFAKISKNRIRFVERWINQRPMKYLKYSTPAEVYKAERCT